MSHILVNIQSAWDSSVEFQREDAEFAAAQGSVVLGHSTGLGKSFISQLAWSKWQANKGLIVGTLGSLAGWSKNLRKWSGVQPVFMQGMNDPSWREALQAKEGIWMCTYNTFLYLMKTVQRGKPRFDVLINDELHRMMRSRNKMWASFKRLDFDHYLGLSATWASRGPQDLFPVLNLVNRRTFPSYWRFVGTWCYVDKTEFGTQVYGVRNIENLRRMLWGQYYRARTWPEVGNQFRKDPRNTNDSEPVIRRAEEVPMGLQQTRLLRELDRDMIVTLNNEMVVTPNSLALLTRKLQMAISPKILMPSAEYGGPVEWLADKVLDDPHTVIFCPYREGLQVIKQRLIEGSKGSSIPEEDIFVLQGGISPDKINQIIAAWKKSKGVALCTVDFAQSFELDTTDNAYFLGFSWDPNNNYQAEGRLRRFDSILQTPCNVTYIVPEQSDYNQVIYVVDGKIADTRDYLEGYIKNYVRTIKLSDLPLEEKDGGNDEWDERGTA